MPRSLHSQTSEAFCVLQIAQRPLLTCLFPTSGDRYWFGGVRWLPGWVINKRDVFFRTDRLINTTDSDVSWAVDKKGSRSLLHINTARSPANTLRFEKMHRSSEFKREGVLSSVMGWCFSKRALCRNICISKSLSAQKPKGGQGGKGRGRRWFIMFGNDNGNGILKRFAKCQHVIRSFLWNVYVLLRFFWVARSTYVYTVTEAYSKRICGGGESSKHMIVMLDQTLTMIKTNIPLAGRGGPVPPRAMVQKDAPSLRWCSSHKRQPWDSVR